MREVVLVIPPFFSLVRPSLGASSLKAALAAAGQPATVLSLNLDFAAELTASFAEWVALEADYRWLLGEWIFAPYVGGSRTLPDEADYFGEVARGLPAELRQRVVEARRAAGAWVARWGQRIAARRPLLVGFSSSYHQTCASLALARAVKEHDPALPVVFGGANCDGTMGAALAARYPQVDHVLAGEAEESLVALARAVATGTPWTPPAERGCVADLDALPPPDVSDWFEALAAAPFRDEVQPGLAIEASRGCWWGMRHHCPFCGVNGAGLRFRRKRSARVLQEIEALSARYAVPRFEASDSILADALVGGVFDRLAERDAGVDLFFQVRPDLTDDQLTRLARGGLTWLQAGIESLDGELLRAFDKGTTRLDVLRFLRATLEIGLRPIWYLLHGAPGEGDAPYERMAALVGDIEHLPPPRALVPIHLDRFSPYVREAERHGIRDIRPLPAYRHVFALPDDGLRAVASLFEGTIPGAAAPTVIAALRERLRGWTDRFVQAEGRAAIDLLPLPQGAFVRDTRSSAVAGWSVLEPADLQVLAAYRDPAPLAAAAERSGLPPAIADASLAGLVARRLVLTEDDRGVSIVPEPGRRVHGPERPCPFPGGELLAR